MQTRRTWRSGGGVRQEKRLDLFLSPNRPQVGGGGYSRASTAQSLSMSALDVGGPGSHLCHTPPVQ